METIAFMALNMTLGGAVILGLLQLVDVIAAGRRTVRAAIRSLPSLESDNIAA